MFQFRARRRYASCRALASGSVALSVVLSSAAAQTPDPALGVAGQPLSQTLSGLPQQGSLPSSSTPLAPSGEVKPHYEFYAPGEALANERDPVAAKVEGRLIRLSEIGDALGALPEEGRRQPFEIIYPALLQNLVDRAALYLKAHETKLDADPIARRRMQEASDLALVNEYLRRVVDEKVTEAAIRARYSQMYGKAGRIEEIRLRSIVVHSPDQALMVIQQLRSGADFDQLAKKVSVDPTGAAGGDLGYVRRDQLQPLAAEAAFGLKDGEISQAPVPDRIGWDVFRVDGRRTVPAPSYEEARPAIRQHLVEQTVVAEANAARRELSIQTFNVDGTPFSSRGPDPVFDEPLHLETNQKH